MKPRSKAADLLKVLGQKSVAPTAAKPKATAPERRDTARGTETRSPDRQRARNRTAPQTIRGKAIQFYLHAPDEKLIREFAVWLAPHRKRINDSLVIKTVLRATKAGPELLAAYDAAVKVDGRTAKKHLRRPDQTA